MYSQNKKKSKRRQILQLDYDDDSSRSTPSPTGLSHRTNGKSSSPAPPAPPAPPAAIVKPQTAEMDDEFANFMAEIDAIDADTLTPPPPPDEDKATEAPIEEKAEKEEDKKGEEFTMTEPICQWQQCLDDGTQCYYYWNMDSNEVSWQIPPEFTQHLLLYNEYEVALSAFNARKLAREAKAKKKTSDMEAESDGQGPDKKLSPGKDQNTKLGQGQDKKLGQGQDQDKKIGQGQDRKLGQGQDQDKKLQIPEVSVASGDEDSKSALESASSPQESASTSAGSQPATEQGRNFLWFMRDHEREEKERQEDKKRAYAQKFVKGKTLDEEKKDLPDDSKNVKDALKDSRDEYLRTIRSSQATLLTGKGRKSKFLERIGAYDKKKAGAGDGSDDVTTTTVTSGGDQDDDDDDVDDEELELLLELQKKQAELMALEMEVCNSSSPSNTPEPPPAPEPEMPPLPDLPPLPSEPEPEPPAKRIKLNDKDDKSVNDLKDSFIPKEGSLAETKDQAEIEELSGLLTGKLESMQITRESVSKMQITLIEIQTRIVDWVAGALSTSHFLTKLRHADLSVKEYESIAAPPGWSCHYDRYAPPILNKALSHWRTYSKLFGSLIG